MNKLSTILSFTLLPLLVIVTRCDPDASHVPTLTIILPLEDQVILKGDTIRIEIQAFDEDEDLSHMYLFIDSTLIDSSEGDFLETSYIIDYQSPSQRQIRAVVYDMEGGSSSVTRELLIKSHRIILTIPTIDILVTKNRRTSDWEGNRDTTITLDTLSFEISENLRDSVSTVSVIQTLSGISYTISDIYNPLDQWDNKYEYKNWNIAVIFNDDSSEVNLEIDSYYFVGVAYPDSDWGSVQEVQSIARNIPVVCERNGSYRSIVPPLAEIELELIAYNSESHSSSETSSSRTTTILNSTPVIYSINEVSLAFQFYLR